MPYPMKEVIENTLQGVANAQHEYERWSGCWLCKAPEYFMTTCIAREISSNRQHSYWVTLESNVRHVMNVAGALGQGRPRNDLRLDGDFDIVLWWANLTPRTVIEVKRHVRRFQTIEDDVARICSVLQQRSTIRNGMVVYYSRLEGEAESLMGCMADRLASIDAAARDYVVNRRMDLNHYHREATAVRDSAWTTGLFKISRR